MKPIWYFVGLFLVITGAIVTGAGIYDLVNPPVQKTVLAELHPGVWWGAVIVISGALFLLFNRKKRID